MRLRLGDLFRVRRVTFLQLRAGWCKRPATCRRGDPQSTTHSILFMPPTLFLPWAVVSEYRARLQQRLNPKQKDSVFESPALLEAGEKCAVRDCTPAPTPTEVSTPHQRVEPPAGSGWGLLVPNLFMPRSSWPLHSSCCFPGLLFSEMFNNDKHNDNSYCLLC